jgi:hypothetical protein
MRINRAAMIVGFLLILASLANGSVSYLKRVGFLDQDAYTRFIEVYCSSPAGDLCLCMGEPLPSFKAYATSLGSLPHENYIYATNGYERLVKICKDLLFAGFFVFSCYLIFAKGLPLIDRDALAPPLTLLTLIGIGFLISALSWGGGFALLGLRSFAFLAIALVGSWAFFGIQGIAGCVAALLVLQLLLVGIEVSLGIPLRDCPNSFRAAGTMVLPNSLGAFAVISLAFYQTYSSTKQYFPLLLVLSAITLFASGSGTGILALFVFLGMLVMNNFAGLQKGVFAVTFLSLGVILLIVLPDLTQRPDLYNSVFSSDGLGGRTGLLIEALSGASAIEILFGRGIGFGTNTAKNVFGSTFAADSTVTVLFTQLGIIGIVVFYGILAWAYQKDVSARPVYLVLAVTSLTINIIEFFPANFLFGLILAGTLTLSSRARGETTFPSRPQEHYSHCLSRGL